MRYVCVFALMGAAAVAQESGRVSASFADPSRPGVLNGSLLNGCFTVEGYDGREIIVEGGNVVARGQRTADGMRRLGPRGAEVTVDVEGNTATIRGPMNTGMLTIRAPRNTSLKLKCLNGGDLTVSNVTGDLELNHQNASVTAKNVSGSVLAHSINGKITVSFDRVAADKPMSFSTLNGDIDVTLPADTRANVRVKSDNGEARTDFDVRMNPTQQDRGDSGHRHVSGQTMTGSINGGGPEFSFKTLNGNIYLRKKK